MDMRVERGRHDRLMRPPAFLGGAFRPFFLGGAVWALIVVGLWVGALTGALSLPTAFDPLAWHRHEMLFGYLGAVIAGFLLTAIPNWTGRPAMAGIPLAALAILWVAARVAILISAGVGPSLAFALDVAFLLLLALVAGREIVAANNRNVPIVLVILLFAAASAADHAEALGASSGTGEGWRGGFALVLVLIGLIGGRIIPAFTRNWLMKQGRTTRLPAQPGRFDVATLLLTALALGVWVFAPTARWTALLLLVAGFLQMIRLVRWSGLSAARDPLVFILHISYAWLPIGLLLLGASILSPEIPGTSALHALAAGAMGSMTLAVMTRATLGHTGRALAADGWTVLIYGMVTLGAALRVGAALIPFDYMRTTEFAGLLWGGAFLLFVAVYGPKLISPRLEEKPRREGHG